MAPAPSIPPKPPFVFVVADAAEVFVVVVFALTVVFLVTMSCPSESPDNISVLILFEIPVVISTLTTGYCVAEFEVTFALSTEKFSVYLEEVALEEDAKFFLVVEAMFLVEEDVLKLLPEP